MCEHTCMQLCALQLNHAQPLLQQNIHSHNNTHTHPNPPTHIHIHTQAPILCKRRFSLEHTHTHKHTHTWERVWNPLCFPTYTIRACGPTNHRMSSDTSLREMHTAQTRMALQHSACTQRCCYMQERESGKCIMSSQTSLREMRTAPHLHSA